MSSPFDTCEFVNTICTSARTGQRVTTRLPLDSFENEQHIQVARAFFAQGNERLVFGRVIPGIKGIHIRELYDHNSLRFPVAALWQFVASAFCQVTSTMLDHHRRDLGPVFVKFS